jgi:hypothetical protein
MNREKCAWMACAAAIAVLLLPASATASKASIKAAIASFNHRVTVAEDHVGEALERYETTKDPAPVASALQKSIAVIRALRTKVADQSAHATRVKHAKAKILTGLELVVIADQQLIIAYDERQAEPAAAASEAEEALAKVKRGRHLLLEGVTLLE